MDCHHAIAAVKRLGATISDEVYLASVGDSLSLKKKHKRGRKDWRPEDKDTKLVLDSEGNKIIAIRNKQAHIIETSTNRTEIAFVLKDKILVNTYQCKALATTINVSGKECEYVDMRCKHRGVTESMSILMAHAFLGPPPASTENMSVDHTTRNRLHNAIWGLRWATGPEQAHNHGDRLHRWRQQCDDLVRQGLVAGHVDC